MSVSADEIQSLAAGLFVRMADNMQMIIDNETTIAVYGMEQYSSIIAQVSHCECDDGTMYFQIVEDGNIYWYDRFCIDDIYEYDPRQQQLNDFEDAQIPIEFLL